MIEIVKGKVEDALQIAIVKVYTWKTQYSGIISDKVIDNRIKDIEEHERKIQNRITLSDNYIVAKKDGTVIGFCCFGKCEDSSYEEYGEIRALYLLEGFHGKGIGRMLFEEGMKNIKKLGYNKARINCLQHNPTLEFYKHMGGKVVGSFKNDAFGEPIYEDIITYEL